MQWIPLTTAGDLETIREQSFERPVLIFKHSTRCPVSNIAMHRLQTQWDFDDDAAPLPYYLDLIRYRELSNQIAEDYAVLHESPQVLLIRNGQCVYHTSHLDISVAALPLDTDAT